MSVGIFYLTIDLNVSHDSYPSYIEHGVVSISLNKKYALTERATTFNKTGICGIIISIHALTWRATSISPSFHVFTSISIHALTWRATDLLFPNQQPYAISIHALTWRATWLSCFYVPKYTISIHALTWRATIAATSPRAPFLFQFTLSRGERRDNLS